MPQKINILITNVDGQPQYIGGIKRVSMTLADCWLRQGHSVSFLTYCPCAERYSKLGGCVQHFIPGKEASHEENLKYISDLIKAGAYDIILNQHIEDKWISKLCFKVRETTGIKLVSAYHFAPTYTIDEKDAWYVKAPVNSGIRHTLSSLKWRLKDRRAHVRQTSEWFREVIKSSDAFVLLSDRFITDMVSFMGTNDNKLKAINNPAIFESCHCIDKLDTVIWCGRLGTGFKRTDLMLKVWAMVEDTHPDWHCVIMGSGDTAYWTQQASNMGLKNVTFTGFCNPEEYYRKAKIFCMTSVTEGWGLVLIESMSNGCVPMAFDSFGSVRDIIHDGDNGVLVRSFDISEYASKLAKLMDDEKTRKAMSEKAYLQIDRYNPEEISRKWIGLFNEL